MKIFSLSLLTTALLIGVGHMSSDAAVLVLGGSAVNLNAGQPIQAVIVDSNGNTVEQTVYYNPILGGVDVDASWAGPNASIYFPSLDNGFVWYNGFWVDKSGYYWNGGRRLYVNHPHWTNYWGGYWQNHGNLHGGHDWHGGGHEGNWHGAGHERNGQGGAHENNWRGEERRGGEARGRTDGEARGHDNGHGHR